MWMSKEILIMCDGVGGGIKWPLKRTKILEEKMYSFRGEGKLKCPMSLREEGSYLEVLICAKCLG